MGNDSSPHEALRTGEKPADRIAEEVRAAFPEGTIQQVQALRYGDDPEMEPGQTAIRVFIDQDPPPPGTASGGEALHRFVRANRDAVKKLHRQLPSLDWVEFRLGGQDLAHGPAIRRRIDLNRYATGPGGQATAPGEGAGELTSVMTRFGPEDLATVDTLITAGIANSRAEVLRWAIGRIREHPAYAQIQDRVHEISELKAQF